MQDNGTVEPTKLEKEKYLQENCGKFLLYIIFFYTIQIEIRSIYIFLSDGGYVHAFKYVFFYYHLHTYVFAAHQSENRLPRSNVRQKYFN